MEIKTVSDLYDLFESEGETYGLVNFVNEETIAGVEDDDLRDALRVAWHAAKIVSDFQEHVYTMVEDLDTEDAAMKETL